MRKTVDKLDKWLCENKPEYYQMLNPGLSDDDIRNWESKFGFGLPEDLKILYQWKNGSTDECREYFFEYCFFDPIEMLYEQWDFGKEDLLEYNEEGKVNWGKSWLRFMSTWNGDGYCLDMNGDLGEPGNIVYYVHDSDGVIMYSGLKVIIEEVIQVLLG